MRISPEQVREVAALARLGLSQGETEKLAAELERILGYVEQLGEVDTRAVEVTSHAVPIVCPTRDDAWQPSGIEDRILDRVPEREDRFIRVPKIID